MTPHPSRTPRPVWLLAGERNSVQALREEPQEIAHALHLSADAVRERQAESALAVQDLQRPVEPPPTPRQELRPSHRETVLALRRAPQRKRDGLIFAITVTRGRGQAFVPERVDVQDHRGERELVVHRQVLHLDGVHAGLAHLRQDLFDTEH